MPQEELQWLSSQRVTVGERAVMQMVGVDKVAKKNKSLFITKLESLRRRLKERRKCL